MIKLTQLSLTHGLLLFVLASTTNVRGQDAPNSEPKSIQVPDGINDKFKAPDLNVDEWLARFEVESREV